MNLLLAEPLQWSGAVQTPLARDLAFWGYFLLYFTLGGHGRSDTRSLFF